ncbi:MAG: hypothetical protein IPG61_08500 [bacterium]|nr:hypothetical protein [bacterium]
MPDGRIDNWERSKHGDLLWKREGDPMCFGFAFSGEDLRVMYTDTPSCRCTASGDAVAVDALTVRTMNFGQHWRTPGAVDEEYSLELPATYVRDFLERNLPEWRLLAQEDHDPDDRLGVALCGADWPDTQAVVTDPDRLALVFEVFGREILDIWCGAHGVGADDCFVLNTVDSVGVVGRRVRVTGRALKKPDKAAYQDI